jgi:hypothetical protein
MMAALCALVHAPAARADRHRRKTRTTTVDPSGATTVMDTSAVPKKLGRTYTQQIEDRLTWLGDQMDAHFGRLSLDEVAFKFDGRDRRAKIRLGKGDGKLLSMRIDGDVKFENGLAHVDAAINLSINGYQMHLDLPQVDLVPSSYQGEKYLEVRIPLIKGTFEPEKWLQALQ